MLPEKHRKYLDQCFQHQKSESDAMLAQSALYCAAQWICYYNGSSDVQPMQIQQILDMDQMRTILRLLVKDCPVRFRPDILRALCHFIHHAKLMDDRAKLFYQLYLTSAVSDTSLFADSTLPSFSDGPVSCTIIHLALLQANGEQGRAAIFETTVPEVYNLLKNTLTYLGVDYDEFERYWSAVHWLEASYNVRKRQKIEKAVRVYQKFHVPVSALLEHYAQARHFQPEELRQIINPWEHVNRKLKDSVPESGMTVEEQLYNDAAYQISRERPTDVIQTIFYRGRDDAKIEVALVRSEFRRLRRTTKHCLIVNPSPAVLLELDSLWELSADVEDGLEKSCITIAVNDSVVAFLYGQQFPDYCFIPIDDLWQMPATFDHVIILARDHDTAPLWHALSCCEDRAFVTMLLPQTVMTSRDPLFAQGMRENQIYTDWILDVPQVLTGSEPRKKMLLAARRGAPYASESTRQMRLLLRLLPHLHKRRL